MRREYEPVLHTGTFPQIDELLHEYIDCGQVTNIASRSLRSQVYCVTLAASCDKHDILTIREVLQNSGFKTTGPVQPKRSTHYTLKKRPVSAQKNLVSHYQLVHLVMGKVNAPNLPEGIKPFPPLGGKPQPGQQVPTETNGDKKKRRKGGKKRRR